MTPQEKFDWMNPPEHWSRAMEGFAVWMLVLGIIALAIYLCVSAAL